jgi:ribosomal protein L40E
MAEMQNIPVLICKRCSKAYSFSAHTNNDQEGTLLFQVMHEMAEEKLCAECTARKSWYIQQNRLADWERGDA